MPFTKTVVYRISGLVAPRIDRNRPPKAARALKGIIQGQCIKSALDVFTVCSRFVPLMITVCSAYVLCAVQYVCGNAILNFYNIWFVLYLFPVCSLSVHGLFSFVLGLFTLCSRYVPTKEQDENRRRTKEHPPPPPI